MGKSQLQQRWAGAAALGALMLGCTGAASGAELYLAEAVKLALAHNPALAVQAARIDAAGGRSQQAAGVFDWRVASSVDYEKTITPLSASALAGSGPGHPGEAHLVASGYQLAIDKQLRNGLIFSSSLNAVSEELVSARPGRAPLATSKLDVALTVPLLQGRGGAALRHNEAAAQLSEQASRYDLLDRTARILHETLIAYWTYRTRAELETVAASSEERSASLLRSIRTLVEASEKPRADLVLLQADLAEKSGAREAARLALADARTGLGRVLGLERAAIEALGPASDELPVSSAGAPALGVTGLIEQSLLRRPDVQSIGLQVASVRRQLDATSDLAKPRLDVQVGLAHTKVSDGGGRYLFLGAPGRTGSAPSLFARLILELPVQNNSANGAVRERAAILSELSIRQRDLDDGIASALESAVRAVASSRVQLDAAREALAMYEQAVAQEIIKQKNGISTLIDVINTEARFVNARINLLQARLAHASALARLRLESGTLLPATAGERFTLDVSALGGLGPLGADPIVVTPTIRLPAK